MTTAKPVLPSQVREVFFWERVQVGSMSDCWTWTGLKKRGGYGVVHCIDGSRRWVAAHRMSWFLHNGPIPSSRPIITHTCDNPPCVNPAHLRAGTHASNTKDMLLRKRHVSRPPTGVRSPVAKLTRRQLREIRARYAAGGITQYQLADEYGVCQYTICSAINRKHYKRD